MFNFMLSKFNYHIFILYSLNRAMLIYLLNIEHTCWMLSIDVTYFTSLAKILIISARKINAITFIVCKELDNLTG